LKWHNTVPMKVKDKYAFSQDVKIHIEKLHEIVRNSIEAEELIVHRLSHPEIENLTKAERISDKVAQFGGSWKFIISFFTILILWILFNVLAIGIYEFDPSPFILLNLILSCLAALQAPIIMMSQNRLEQKDRIRSENDYLINLKAEMQIRSLNKKVDLLLEEEIKTLFDIQQKQYDLLESINSKLAVKKK
jgi:uncharacterized membrane protein